MAKPTSQAALPRGRQLVRRTKGGKGGEWESGRAGETECVRVGHKLESQHSINTKKK